MLWYKVHFTTWYVKIMLISCHEGVEERLILENVISEMNNSLFYPWVSHIMAGMRDSCAFHVMSERLVAVCCSVLQCVAVCCSVLQCVAACCSVLQRVAVCCSVLQCVAVLVSCHGTSLLYQPWYERLMSKRETYSYLIWYLLSSRSRLMPWHATSCVLQCAATHCNTLQHISLIMEIETHAMTCNEHDIMISSLISWYERDISEMNDSLLYPSMSLSHLDWYRVAKTHRIPYLYRSFSAKVTYI